MAKAHHSLTLLATILGSGVVFLMSTSLTIATPAIGRDLHLDLTGLQLVIDAYLLTLSALMLFGGALGDRGARALVFELGLIGFAGASLWCALAPNGIWLIAGCLLEGAAGAFVVPNSLAILETSFHGPARGAAIGKWAAWSGISTALGPIVGGWLVDAWSWRAMFASLIPIAFAAALAARNGAAHHDIAEQKADRSPLDFAGAITGTIGLASLIGGLTLGPTRGFTSMLVIALLVLAAAAAAAFIIVESRAVRPLLPLKVFRVRQFVGANLSTLAIYAALEAMFFLLTLQLQAGLHYSALQAGASLLPLNALLLLISPASGRLAERIGARRPMAIGAFVAAGGSLLLMRVQAGTSFWTTVIPALLVLGVGLGILVAPLTTAALEALSDDLAGVAAGANNVAARVAGLLAIAVLPTAAGLAQDWQTNASALAAGYVRAMLICATLCAIGAVAAWLLVRDAETASS